MDHALTLPLRDGENWWGLATKTGHAMPFAPGFALDLRGDCHSNQAAPLLLSDRGRWVWSETPFRAEFRPAAVSLTGAGPFAQDVAPEPTLAGAYRAAAARFFPPGGRLCDPLLFTAPQYNTWIELGYEQTQAGILRYAEDIVAHGFPPGVLMIDDGWMRAYGDWHFRADRFPDPAAMVRRLHALGFKVMLWLIPFVSADSAVFRDLWKRGGLVRQPADGNPVVRWWWNGQSAVVDVTGGAGREWFAGELRRLHAELGIDGFKLDGGDTQFFRADDLTAAGATPNGHTAAFATLGLEWPLNEFRACWRQGGLPLAQRLCDKNHSWDEKGMGALVPHAIAAGLLGHPFVCPDMIGGGEIFQFHTQRDRLDPELFVRHAQCSALMPMMQFSAAPWRVLDARHRDLCLAAARLHAAWGERLLALARAAAEDGEPIVRALAYVFPEGGYATVRDQFMLGDAVMVAPVVTKDARRRDVHIPPGRWRDDRGVEHAGPAVATLDAPLDRLPHFERLEA